MSRPDRQTQGACLCGRVRVQLARPMHDVGVCHCTTCRRWGGGPWLALQAPDARIDGPVMCYRSSAFAERGFCAKCGTHIFHRPVDGPELAVSAGLFDDADFTIAREIFIDRKPPFYRFEADSRKRTSAGMMLEWLPKLAWRMLRRRFGR